MSQSSMVSYTLLSPFCTKPRVYPITKITIHHMAGDLSVEQCGRVFQTTASKACSHYGVDNKGRVGQYCLEENRAWCSANYDNDNRAVNIEVANDGDASTNWHVSDKAISTLIDLCVDICKRNGIAKLNFTGDKTGNLTMHQYFISTTCPGGYLKSKFPYIANEVNKRLATIKPISNSPIYLKIGRVSGNDRNKFIAKLDDLYISFREEDGYIITTKLVSAGDQIVLINLGQMMNVPVVQYKQGEEIAPAPSPSDDYERLYKELTDKYNDLEAKYTALKGEYALYKGRIQDISKQLQSLSA